jgi:hypothetical protein
MNETTTEKNVQIGMRDAAGRDQGIPDEREAGKGFEHVRDVAASVAHGVSNAASYVRQKAEDVIPREGEIAKGMENVKSAARNAAHNVSDAASYVRHKADNATTAVGGAMEDTGHYLRDDGINRIATDLTNLVRRHPVPAMLAGLAVGYLIAQATHRRGGFSPRPGDLHD